MGEHEDRVISIVKGKYGLKNKSDVVNYVVERFEEQILEPQLRPEYVEKLERIKKQKGVRFSTINIFRNP